VGVRANLACLGRELVGAALEFERLVEARLPQFNPGVRVDNGGIFDVLVELLAGPHVGLHL